MFNMRKFCALFFTLLMWVNLAEATEHTATTVAELQKLIGTYAITQQTTTDNTQIDVLTFTEGTAKDGDTITLSGTTYTLTQTLYIRKSLTLKGTTGTVLDGNNQYQVLRIGDSYNDVKVTLDTLKITKGKPDGKLTSGGGGGVYVGPGAEVTITNCEITENNATYNNQGSGGGIYVDGGTEHTNTIKDADGNELSNTTITVSPGKLTLQDSKITKNTAYTSGGGIHIQSEADVTITNCDITENTATATNGDIGGGGIFTINAKLTITNCNISNNTCTSGPGGGILCYGDEIINISQCTIVGNKATDSSHGVGGGIYSEKWTQDDVATPVITNSTMSSNEAVNGGAIYAKGTNPVINNCSFINNVDTGGGDEIFWVRASTNSTMTVTNSLFWGDSQKFGWWSIIDYDSLSK